MVTGPGCQLVLDTATGDMRCLTHSSETMQIAVSLGASFSCAATDGKGMGVRKRMGAHAGRHVQLTKQQVLALHKFVATGMAQTATCPPQYLEWLSEHPSTNIREHACANPNTPDATLRRVAAGRDQPSLVGAAANPRLATATADHIQAWALDRWETLRQRGKDATSSLSRIVSALARRPDRSADIMLRSFQVTGSVHLLSEASFPQKEAERLAEEGLANNTLSRVYTVLRREYVPAKLADKWTGVMLRRQHIMAAEHLQHCSTDAVLQFYANEQNAWCKKKFGAELSRRGILPQ